MGLMCRGKEGTEGKSRAIDIFNEVVDELKGVGWAKESEESREILYQEGNVGDFDIVGD